MRKWLLLSLSACLYAFPFIMPGGSCLVLFVFLAPLFYAAHFYRLGAREGFIWSLVAWGPQLIFLLDVLLTKAEVPWYGALLGWCLALSYVSIYGALWFACAGFLQTTVAHSKVLSLSIWACSAYAYFITVERLLLWVFDYPEGYFFAYPLVPLMRYPVLLYALAFISKEWLLSALIVFNSALVYSALYGRSWYSFLVLILVSVPFISGFIYKPALLQAPEWITKIGVVQASAFEQRWAWERAHELTNHYKALIEKYPELACIILPESSFKFPLNKLTAITEMWHTYALQHRALVIGGHRYSDGNLYNTLYCIQNGSIQALYDKKHGMPLVERVPRWFSWPLLKQLFLDKHVPFCQCTQERRAVPLYDTYTCMPFICSDLFFSVHKSLSTEPLLALVNDAWFSCAYQQELMFLVARFKAHEWRQDLLYVSYTKAHYIAQDGNYFPLKVHTY